MAEAAELQGMLPWVPFHAQIPEDVSPKLVSPLRRLRVRTATDTERLIFDNLVCAIFVRRE